MSHLSFHPFQQHRTLWIIFLLLAIWLFLCTQTHSQIVDAVEYYYDTDPGYGNATSIPITPAESLQVSITSYVPIQTGGAHTLYVRARQNGVWGLPGVHRFWCEPTAPGIPNITRLEFYFDNDPGVGFATALPLVGSDTTLRNITIPIENITPGFHWLCLRAIDAYGGFSIPVTRPLWVEAVEYNRSQVTGAEVFFDTDPGAGNGSFHSFIPADSLTTQMVADLSTVSVGYHNMGVRIKDSAGKWSLPYMKRILVVAPPDAPQYLMISYTNGNAVLSWLLPTVPMDGFRIYRHPTGHFNPPATGTLIATVDGNTTTYTDVGVGGEYYYRVTAFVIDE